MLVWRCDRVDFETAWIEGPAKAANDAALAGGIPSLKHEDRPLRGPEIGLLDKLKDSLKRRQTPLVIGEVHFGKFADLRQPWAAHDDEILRIHGVLSEIG